MSTALDGEVRLAVLRHFAERAEPPSPNYVATAAGMTRGAVRAAYERLAAQHVIVLAPGTEELWMAAPFSAVPTAFRSLVRGREYFGNCIWDALGIVALLGGTGRVRTLCGHCGEPLELSVSDRRPAGDGIAHFLVPASRWWDNIGFT